MAIKEHPLKTWDDLDITDPIRSGLAGSPLLFCAALCVIKGDWAEFCSTFAFATWQSKIAPCLQCWCTKANYALDEAFGIGSEVWAGFTFEDYLRACEQSEVHVVVNTIEQLRRVRSALWYDRRKNRGGHGRCLRWAVPDLPRLCEGDRLEPSEHLRDVGLIDSMGIEVLPLQLIFWRKGQARVTHRNLLFDAAIGVTHRIMGTDHLHAVNLGVVQKFSTDLVWAMFLNPVWTEKKG